MGEYSVNFDEDRETCDLPGDSVWSDLEQADRLARAVSFFVTGQMRLAPQAGPETAATRPVKLTLFAFGVAEEMMRLAGIGTPEEQVAQVVYLSLLVGGEQADALKMTTEARSQRSNPELNLFSLYGRTAVQMLVREEEDTMQMFARALGENNDLRHAN
jgi:hypothetical protein